MARRPETLRRVSERIESLTTDFEDFLLLFEQRRPFSEKAWSLHLQTIQFGQGTSSVSELARDDHFIGLVRDTVSAWGMNSRGAKLLDEVTYRDRIRAEADSLSRLQDLRLEEIGPNDLKSVTSQVWEALSRVRASATKSFVVAASKTLHHFLPNLIPPIDRQFTYTFFAFPKELEAHRQKVAFEFLFPKFHEIAVANLDAIDDHVGRNVHSSVTKTIDNAIIGYGLAHQQKRGLQ